MSNIALRDIKESRDPFVFTKVDIKMPRFKKTNDYGFKMSNTGIFKDTGVFEHLLYGLNYLKQKVYNDKTSYPEHDKPKLTLKYFDDFVAMNNVPLYKLIYSINGFIYLLLKIINNIQMSLNITSVLLFRIYVTEYEPGHNVLRMFKSKEIYTGHFNYFVKNHKTVFNPLLFEIFEKNLFVPKKYFDDEIEIYYSFINNMGYDIKPSFYSDKTIEEISSSIYIDQYNLSEYLKNEWDYSPCNPNSIKNRFSFYPSAFI